MSAIDGAADGRRMIQTTLFTANLLDNEGRLLRFVYDSIAYFCWPVRSLPTTACYLSGKSKSALGIAAKGQNNGVRSILFTNRPIANPFPFAM